MLEFECGVCQGVGVKCRLSVSGESHLTPKACPYPTLSASCEIAKWKEDMILVKKGKSKMLFRIMCTIGILTGSALITRDLPFHYMIGASLILVGLGGWIEELIKEVVKETLRQNKDAN